MTAAVNLCQASRELADAFHLHEATTPGCFVSRFHRDTALVRWVFERLADPASGYGPALDVVWEHRHRAEVAS